MTITIYHNPRCSKSRQTLALIKDAGIEPEIILYLENPPSVSELETLQIQLGFDSAQSMMRKNEAEYKELGLKGETDNKLLLTAMATHPRLIERPIVVSGDAAALGRPPENVKALLG